AARPRCRIGPQGAGVALAAGRADPSSLAVFCIIQKDTSRGDGGKGEWSSGRVAQWPSTPRLKETAPRAHSATGPLGHLATLLCPSKMTPMAYRLAEQEQEAEPRPHPRRRRRR